MGTEMDKATNRLLLGVVVLSAMTALNRPRAGTFDVEVLAGSVGFEAGTILGILILFLYPLYLGWRYILRGSAEYGTLAMAGILFTISLYRLVRSAAVLP